MSQVVESYLYNNWRNDFYKFIANLAKLYAQPSTCNENEMSGKYIFMQHIMLHE